MGRKKKKEFIYVVVIKGKEYEWTGEFTKEQAEAWYNRYGKLHENKGYKLRLKKLIHDESNKPEKGIEISETAISESERS